ncbi:hypothetical protein AWZ03_007306 [Drosophila navojoa]|uniref:Uncharacterized protein n=1 Tax=Drosophila navojoa TaxID=7232 RepID=A0A484BE03_DRONA|nr:uncharacterized protein LOC108658851 [Drosophila navojoa]TDG46230.1 hypothetical protein AWZ03_007306 [Drosophila navojoa]
MLYKSLPLILLVAQCLLAAPAPSQPNDLTQKQLEQEAQNETINLLNALFRAQIAYFSGVRDKLDPKTKRSADIALYLSRLNAAIAEKDLDKKNTMWQDIFEEFNKTSLLSNRVEETGLSNSEYQALLTDKKLQEITKSFVIDVTTYFVKMAQFSGKVVKIGIDEYMSTFDDDKKKH